MENFGTDYIINLRVFVQKTGKTGQYGKTESMTDVDLNIKTLLEQILSGPEEALRAWKNGGIPVQLLRELFAHHDTFEVLYFLAGYAETPSKILEELGEKQGKSKMVELFDQKAKGSTYSRNEVWIMMQALGDDEGNYKGGSSDLDDPLRRRYAYAFAGHLHSLLEDDGVDYGYVASHLKNADFNPILLKLLASKYGDTAAASLVDYFVNNIMRENQHFSSFSESWLDRFGTYWYFNNPNELDEMNCCTPANRENFISRGEEYY